MVTISAVERGEMVSVPPMLVAVIVWAPVGSLQKPLGESGLD
jgi:hypothetical protein